MATYKIEFNGKIMAYSHRLNEALDVATTVLRGIDICERVRAVSQDRLDRAHMSMRGGAIGYTLDVGGAALDFRRIS